MLFVSPWNACLRLSVVLATFASWACSLTVPGAPQLAGLVVDEADHQVEGAHITDAHSHATAVTDSTGRFELPLTQPTGDLITLVIQADGYARSAMSMRVGPRGPGRINVTLRPVAVDTTITLPQTGAAPAVIPINQGDSNSRLTIPADVMVTPDGKIADGNVQVRMTFWNPNESLDSAPSLMAHDVHGWVVPLISYGMADIELEQDGQLLQVAPGKQLAWDVVLPTHQRQMLAALPTVANGLSLYYLDPNTGMWEFASSAAPLASYDATTGTIHGTLPHLSVWNFDGACNFQGAACNTTANGGCVTGRVLTCAGTPLPNQAFRIWGLSQDGLKNWDQTTDSSGNYCVEIGMHDTIGGHTTMGLHLSDVTSDQASNFVSPINPATSGTNCNVCDPSVEPVECNGCTYGNVASITTDPSTGAQDVEIDWGAIHPPIMADLVEGTFCPDSCTPLPDLRLGAECAGLGSCNVRMEGDPCGDVNDCCVANTQCLDSLCVPNSDGL